MMNILCVYKCDINENRIHYEWDTINIIKYRFYLCLKNNSNSDLS